MGNVVLTQAEITILDLLQVLVIMFSVYNDTQFYLLLISMILYASAVA